MSACWLLYIEIWVAHSGVQTSGTVPGRECIYQVTCIGNIRHLAVGISGTTSVADPDHFDTDPGPAFHFVWNRILL
jgi:hypothetical protein